LAQGTGTIQFQIRGKGGRSIHGAKVQCSAVPGENKEAHRREEPYQGTLPRLTTRSTEYMV
jgi:hypothetical protein